MPISGESPEHAPPLGPRGDGNSSPPVVPAPFTDAAMSGGVPLQNGPPSAGPPSSSSQGVAPPVLEQHASAPVLDVGRNAGPTGDSLPCQVAARGRTLERAAGVPRSSSAPAPRCITALSLDMVRNKFYEDARQGHTPKPEGDVSGHDDGSEDGGSAASEAAGALLLPAALLPDDHISDVEELHPPFEPVEDTSPGQRAPRTANEILQDRRQPCWRISPSDSETTCPFSVIQVCH